jgi:hypothetical protein
MSSKRKGELVAHLIAHYAATVPQPGLDGVVRGAEEKRLNHGGSRAEMSTHDLDNPACSWEAAREGNFGVGFAPTQPCGPDLHRDIARRSHIRALWLGKLIMASRT